MCLFPDHSMVEQWMTPPSIHLPRCARDDPPPVLPNTGQARWLLASQDAPEPGKT
jgi:hypothetical protein